MPRPLVHDLIAHAEAVPAVVITVGRRAAPRVSVRVPVGAYDVVVGIQFAVALPAFPASCTGVSLARHVDPRHDTVSRRPARLDV